MKRLTKFLTLNFLLCLNLSLFAGNRYVWIYITPPSHDGGSPVIGYIIEKQIVGQEKWVKIGRTIDREYVATGLEAIKYEFRVIAANKYGNSKPSLPKEADLRTETSAQVTCECYDCPGPVKSQFNSKESNWCNYLLPLKQTEIKIPYRF